MSKPTGMRRAPIYRDLLWLLGLALAVRLITALLVCHPGPIMDAYYYLDGAIGLAEGCGFSDPFLWNYLDDPAGIPHPSHLYWMPLSSLVMYPLLAWFGSAFRLAQVPFVLLSALLPLLSYMAAWQIAGSRRQAWLAGLLTVFSGFYMIHWVTPDNFAPFALAGAGCLLTLGQGFADRRPIWFALAGLCAGLAHLSRSDGVLLLAAPIILAVLRLRPFKTSFSSIPPVSLFLIPFALFLLSYLLIMMPWFARNMLVIGRPLAVTGVRSIWLTSYDDLYSVGRELSWRTFWDWGWGNILRSRLYGLWLNLQTLLFVNWMIALAPLGLIGVWRLRKHPRFAPAWVYGLLLYLTMSLVFTFPGIRGAMLHSSVALLPFLFAAAMDGLDALVDWVAARRSEWHAPLAKQVFGGGLVGIAALLSVFLMVRSLPRYRQPHLYADLSPWIAEHIPPQERVWVNDPPAFYYYTRRECLAIPNEKKDVLTRLAEKYNARYLILDHNAPQPLRPWYDSAAENLVAEGRQWQLMAVLSDRKGGAILIYKLEEQLG